MKLTNYRITNIENMEEFLNKLFAGLKRYERLDKGFKFKLTYTKDTIELKTFNQNESIN